MIVIWNDNSSFFAYLYTNMMLTACETMKESECLYLFENKQVAYLIGKFCRISFCRNDFYFWCNDFW